MIIKKYSIGEALAEMFDSAKMLFEIQPTVLALLTIQKGVET